MLKLHFYFSIQPKNEVKILLKIVILKRILRKYHTQVDNCSFKLINSATSFWDFVDDILWDICDITDDSSSNKFSGAGY